MLGTEREADGVEGARAAVLGGWERAGMGPGAVLKLELPRVSSTGEFMLLRPKVGDSPLRSVKSLKPNNSLDQSLGGASGRYPSCAGAVWVESGGAEDES